MSTCFNDMFRREKGHTTFIYVYKNWHLLVR